MNRQPKTVKGYSFANEDEAKQYVRGMLSSYFDLYPEQPITHWTGKTFRIDFLLTPKSETALSCPFIGVETKYAYKKVTDFHEGVRQAINYRHSKTAKDKHPPYVFVFPGPRSMFEEASHADYWTEGSIRLAGKFHVGFLYEAVGTQGIVPYFQLNGTRWWDAESGFHGQGNFSSHQQYGAKQS